MNLDEAQTPEPNEPPETTSVNSEEQPVEEPTAASSELLGVLENRVQELRKDIADLQATKAKMQQEQMLLSEAMGNLISQALTQLEQRRQALQIEIEKLERRQERIQQEMRTSFAGVSQDLAIRVQGFKDYLVGSLQDLASSAEQLELIPEEPLSSPTAEFNPPIERQSESEYSSTPQFGEQGFDEQAQKIRRILDQYRTMPDYYGPPWQLRRTFEPVHAKLVSSWFFDQGGRGAVRSMGSRLQNILVASAVISVLRTLYNQRLRTLVLANSPERLGEWRRGLQDCLGLDRRDFGPEQGLVLFEDPEQVAQKADRLVQEGKLPLILLDDSEEKISLSLLQYPLWLAFAPEPKPPILY